MIQQKHIHVAIVDDHAMIRNGLCVFLQAFDDLELVGMAFDGAEALHLCADTHVDVLLMDLVMPGIDGIAATRAIQRLYPHIQVVILTSFADQDLVREALASGAFSYLLKNASIDDMANAIRAAADHSGLARSDDHAPDALPPNA
jgi:two-component system, NarL family, response regulator LiaR